ncbi:methyltransferase family protein [Paraglaciecola marina]|uniref:methyltransferase family protein n=1 Tax=Paraglaciecola marina TaxID=2500157 RepID=UPI0010605B51|nr:isoprenylcysteine carboxylmethyltransferase family protein [Paraglaciecola marina]
MHQFISYFLLVYFLLFFGIAVIWRNYKVSKQIGSNAYKLNQKSGVEAIIATYFKYLPLLPIAIYVVYVLFPTQYLLMGPIGLVNHTIFKWVGLGLLIFSFIWVVLAQSQMGASWRIGIDHDQKTDFIQKGLFKYSRNPIFVGIIIISFGYFLILPNAITLVTLALDILLIQVQVTMEEDHLNEQYGKSYIDYCQGVRRWL